MASARSDSVVATRFAAEAGMMGRLNHDQGQLFYSFSLEEAVPDDHLVREIAAVLDLAWVRVELVPYYSSTGRPSIAPERMIQKPERLAADTAYGSGANLNWLVNDKKIAPHIPVIHKSKSEGRTFRRNAFYVDKERTLYTCPAGKPLTTTGRLVNDGETLLYRAS